VLIEGMWHDVAVVNLQHASIQFSGQTSVERSVTANRLFRGHGPLQGECRRQQA